MMDPMDKMDRMDKPVPRIATFLPLIGALLYFLAWLAVEWKLGRWTFGGVAGNYASTWAPIDGWDPPWGRWSMGALAMLWTYVQGLVGFSVLKRLEPSGPPIHRAYFAIPVGMVLCGSAVALPFIFGAPLPSNPFEPLARVGLLVLAAGLTWLHRAELREILAALMQSIRGHRLGAFALSVWVTLALFPALAPATQSDGVRYHLAAISEWMKAGRVEFLPRMAFAQFPFLAEWAMAPGLLATRDPILGGVFAQVTHFGWWLATPLAVRSLARALGMTLPSGFLIEALVWTIPAGCILAGWPFIDHALILLWIAMLAGGAAFIVDPTLGTGLIVGISLGGLLSVKYTMAVPVAITAVWMSIHAIRRVDKPLPIIGAAAIIVLLIGAPWYVKNYRQTGNPVYPVSLGGKLPTPGWPQESADLLAERMASKGEIPFADGTTARPPAFLAWAFVVPHWRSYEAQQPGLLLPFGIMTALALGGFAILRDARTGAREPQELLFVVAHAVIFYFVWAKSYQSARLLLPLVTLLALPFAAIVPRIVGARFMLAIIVVSNLTFTWNYLYAGHRPNAARVGMGLGYGSDDQYLTMALSYYPLAQALNDLQQASSIKRSGRHGAVVVGEHRAYYFNGPVLISDWFQPPPCSEWTHPTALGGRWVALNSDELSLYYPLFIERWMKGKESIWSDFLAYIRANPPLLSSGRYVLPSVKSRIDAVGLPPRGVYDLPNLTSGPHAPR